MTDLPTNADMSPGSEGSTKRRFVIIAASCAVVASAVVTVIAMTGSDDKNPSSATRSSLATGTTAADSTSSSRGSSSTTSTLADPGATTTGPKTTASLPRPTDPITKLPVTTVSSTGTTSPPTNTTGGSPSANAQLEAAYLKGFVDECNAIWSHATNGKLYDPDDTESTFTVDSCTGVADPVFLSSGTKTTTAAAAAGKSDAIDFAALNTSSGQLCWLDTSSDTLLGCWDPQHPDVTTPPTTS